MAWLMITARFKVPGIVLLTILVNLSQPMHISSQNHRGNCASIGYSTKCCPPGESCEASDGNCKCKADCHTYEDCCEDVFCHPKPRTCQDIGCCNSESGSARIQAECNSVHLYDENGKWIPSSQQCNSISNCPQTCAEAKFDVGFCKWQLKPMRETCRVYRGNCYCDPYCVCFGDCCSDVQESEIKATYFALSEECMLMQARLEQALKHNEDNSEPQIIQDVDYNEVYIQYVHAIYARLQEM